jgi:hypothetical protein
MMFKRFLIVLLACLPVLLAAPSHAQAKPHFASTAKEELRHIHKVGAQRYIDDVYHDDPHWNFIASQIETGQAEWLALAQAMMPDADGAASEQLRTNLAMALTAKPSNVLRLFLKRGETPRWGIGNVCDGSIPTPGKKWLTEYKAKAIKSVNSVREPALRDLKARCLATLHDIDLSQPPSSYE